MDDLVKPWILDKIAQGKAILFLGAGAAFGAKGDHGELPLSGFGLRDRISDQFLGGEEKHKTLVQVSDYAKHEGGLLEVQQFIKKTFYPLKPANFHKIIPSFRWHSIFTTNYDLIIERAYSDVPDRMQNIAPIIRDGGNFSDVMSDSTLVPYFKLHGCINTINDPELPLILASEEYAKHKKGRVRLFRHLSDFGLEHPIIFCGYQLSDPNIQQILFDLNDMGVNRPTYLLVDPGLGKYDIKMWSGQRVEPIKATFEDFLSFVDHKIDRRLRALAKLSPSEASPVDRHLKPGLTLSEHLKTYLNTELEHIYSGMKFSGVKPIDFYKGLDAEWGGIRQDLDIKRRVSDQIIIDSVIESSLAGVNTFLLKGYAGSGKSTVLKRVSWYAANDLGAMVVRLRDGAILRPALIKELALKCTSRLILVLDDAISHADDLLKLYRAFEYEPANISILTSARNNEWNQYGADLDQYISSEYEISTLSEKETNDLIEKLSQHNCLGNFKSDKVDDVRKYFSLSADRQLLVALHEATSGKPFEEIVLDEYARITPPEAQILYMDVCTLNRLDVPVRVGLISRISGIGIEEFRNRFFGPLEHVVKVYMDHASRDYAFIARHSLIAKFVFEHALKTPEEKATQIVRVLEHLNLEYGADSEAFNHLIKGKQLAEIFGDKALAGKIYEAADKTGADQHYILHQKAVFEFNHPGCDTRAALSIILQAEKALPEGRADKAIAHTKANIYKRLARESSNSLEIEKYRAEARVIFERLVPGQKDSRAINGLAELQLDELESRIDEISRIEFDDLTKRVFLEQVKKIETTIYTGLQKFPGDEYLLTRQQDLAKKLHDNDRAKNILEEAYEKNSSSEFVSIRLARQRIDSFKHEDAERILRDGIIHNPNSKPLHLELAKLLIKLNNEQQNTEIEHHLKRSFSPSDSNYDAQFWYARHQYLHGDRTKSRDIFSFLKKARMPPRQKNALNGISINSDGNEIIYRGHISHEHVSFCFIKCTELNDSIFAHADRFENLPNEGIKANVDVTFKLAFTMKGPTALSVKIVF
ncbi:MULTISPECIES: SIR2 family protein [unclassified Pseudomonas]|uniref:P-loop NTPase n=1 Tax=unclassified Pseudomonas TaxID=196821 RepID=UPI0009F2280F|nr:MULTISPECIES: SIR2 family protein [unclassified Pseudomonas]QOF86709.1 SIR2 family protein [Pseudomonas sp. ADPe]